LYRPTGAVRFIAQAAGLTRAPRGLLHGLATAGANPIAAGVFVLVRHVDASDGFAVSVFEKQRVVGAEPLTAVEFSPSFLYPVFVEVRATSRIGTPGCQIGYMDGFMDGHMHGYRVSSTGVLTAK
jgi:hypothetical protein